MTGRKKFIISLLIITLIFALFIFAQLLRSYFFAQPRTATSLFNQYYQLLYHHPESAKKALDIILKQYPNNQKALRELGNWYLRQGDVRRALQQFQYTSVIYPNDNYTKQMLAHLNKTIRKKEMEEVAVFPTNATSINDKQIMVNKNISPFISASVLHSILSEETSFCEAHLNNNPLTGASGSMVAVPSTISERDQLLNTFYNLRKTDPQKAWVALETLLNRYPNDVQALKEAGYFLLGEKKNRESIDYFKRAYVLTRDPYLALQIGYLYDGLNVKSNAYYYFDLATMAKDPTERMKAEIAKTNLRGMQVKYIPDPFYTDIMFDPFYHARFKLMIYPLIVHTGVIVNKKYNIKIYLSYRRTSDNKSSNNGQLPQIYEDDAAITAMGIQATPFPKIPMSVFMEAGKAVDIVYKGRSRWRSDFRSGVAYYNEWGKQARYTFTPTFTLKPNMDVYADLIYFTRYRNTIATLRARPGVEVFRYNSMSLNLYLKAFLSEDYDRIFYNDILEVGPSVAFTPNDRYNVTFRYECLRGFYLPSGNSQVNPYGKVYHNNMIFLDTYLSV